MVVDLSFTASRVESGDALIDRAPSPISNISYQTSIVPYTEDVRRPAFIYSVRWVNETV